MSAVRRKDMYDTSDSSYMCHAYHVICCALSRSETADKIALLAAFKTAPVAVLRRRSILFKTALIAV